MQVFSSDFLAQITDAVIAIDLQNRVLFWSQGAERLYGVSAEQMLGQPLSTACRYECLDPQQEQSALDQLRKMGRWFGEDLHILNDGRRLLVESEVSVLAPADGDPLGFIAVIRDATLRREKERVRLSEAHSTRDQLLQEWRLASPPIRRDIGGEAEIRRALRQSNSRFRRLFESDVVGLVVSNGSGHLLEANDYFLRMLGYGREDLSGARLNWLEMTPPEYWPLDGAGIAEALRRGSCTPYEKEYIRRDGSRIPVVIGYATTDTPQDQFTCIVLDISARKRAETALRQAEAQLRALTDAVPMLVWRCNSAGECDYLSSRWVEFTGVSSEASLGYGWLKSLHPEDRAPIMAVWKKSVTERTPFETQFRLRRHDGEYRYFLSRAVPLCNEAPQIQQWIGSSTDVHDQKLAEEALRRSEKLATAGRLAASIAHEINNPLAAVTNSLYLAMQEPDVPARVRDYLSLANQELERVAHVTTQMLRFHRQSTGARRANLAEIMDAAAARCRHQRGAGICSS